MKTLDDTVGKPDFSLALGSLPRHPLQTSLDITDIQMEWLTKRIDNLMMFAMNIGRDALFATRHDDDIHFFIMPLRLGAEPKIVTVSVPNSEYFDSEIGLILENQVVATSTKRLLGQYNAVADLTLVRLLTGIYSFDEAMSEEDETGGIAYFK